MGSMCEEADVKGVHYHHQGFVDLSKLDKKTQLFSDNPKTQYYVCGPKVFMKGIEKSLKAEGIPAERIHMELFGTGGA